MTNFGWSYPPGCNSVPGDEPDPNEDLPTVDEFCEYMGIADICCCLRAIDIHNMEAVDIMIANTDEWLTPGDRRKLKTCHNEDPIEKIRVRGIAWDGSDWEWSEIIDLTKPESTLECVDQARENFNEALAGHQAESGEGEIS